MKDPLMRRLLWIISIAVLATGMVLAVPSWRQAEVTRRRFIKKRRELQALRAVQRDLNKYLAAQAEFAKLPSTKPAPLIILLKELLPAQRAEDMRVVRNEGPTGWFVREAQVTFSDIPVEAAMAFACGAEALRPPWRLTRCAVRAATESPTGRAHVEFSFESVGTDER